MNARLLNAITARLSLRSPQEASLCKLAQALEAAPEMLKKQRDLNHILVKLKQEFPALEDFERDFPSLCFALATGVGKTRLMGAFIAYLYQAHRIENFFVLAPNLTIYDKLITDFSPGSFKYVFKGIAEFATSPPEIITGDNYDQRNPTAGSLFPVKVNIFNISKINSEVRGGKEPRIKRMREVLGESYFNYLAGLPDLVLLMDESHRYRASAGVRAINELNPLFGLELTATPFVEMTGGKQPVPFKNIVMDYPLALAMEDGFVKEPAVVTQRDFDPKQYVPEQIEKIKLEDGIRLHEATKVELITYARENNVRFVKPFMLVIARDTTHASQLMHLIQSDDFYGGRYKDHVIQVDSSKTGAAEEEMIRRLLAVESVDEPTEIVIHVNMLKEGWDVANLYTIVPLRAANARTLIEQSIGRGLRLPYGKRTGVEAVDRLNIVAHDKFQEIIDEANRPESPIRMKTLILEAANQDTVMVSVQIPSRLDLMLNAQLRSSFSSQYVYSSHVPVKPLCVRESEAYVAQVASEVIAQLETQPAIVPNRQSLLMPEMQQQVIKMVQAKLPPIQGHLIEDEKPVDVAEIVFAATRASIDLTIDIPRILVTPIGEVKTYFQPFALDLTNLNLKPTDREIVGQGLQTGKQFVLSADVAFHEKRLEDHIVAGLIDFDDVDYKTHADLLYRLAREVVNHFRSQGYSDDEIRNILEGNRKLIVGDVHSQLMQHFVEQVEGGYEAQVSRGFVKLQKCNYTVDATNPPHHYRETVKDVSKIRQMLFGGFSKCLYPQQKFDSDTERRFSVILERDAEKWFKPVTGQFQLFYRLGSEQKEYIPDFVAEMPDKILMCETKARVDMEMPEVQVKAQAASVWCQHASDYNSSIQSKPWHYLLIPHDEITENKQISYFMRFERSYL